MRKLFLSALVLLSYEGFTKDSLKVKSSNKIWQLELIYFYNYNYRKVGKINDNASYGSDLIHNYLDTGNIACYTNNLGILATRKIWKPISLQTGFIYGRKGYMYSRQVEGYSNGKGRFTDTYIKYIPEKMIIIPVNFNIRFATSNQELKFGLSLGLDFNFYLNRGKETYYYFFNESYLNQETRGFFGFRPAQTMPDKTKLLHDIKTSKTVPYLQHNLGVFIQAKLYKSLFVIIKYNYISQPIYTESKEYKDGSTFFRPVNASVPYLVAGFTYEIKPYIHSFGIGVGFEF